MPVDATPIPQGQVRLYCVNPALMAPPVRAGKTVLRGWQRRTDWLSNKVLYEWSALVGNLLLKQGLAYGIGGMYIEYENTASPGDDVSTPTLTRDADEGADYYSGLGDSANRDYLRVPIIAGAMTSGDTTKFPKGNQPTFFAQTSGTEGVHGKPFSDAHNSTVFGGALVAFVDESDPTQDLVFSRFVLAPSDQQVKLATSQVGVEWLLKLK